MDAVFVFFAKFFHEIRRNRGQIIFAGLTHEGEDVGDLLIVEVDVRRHDVGVVFAVDCDFSLQAFEHNFGFQ